MWGVVRIAFRNTRRRSSDLVLLGGAIAFGVMIITLVNAFTQGAVGNVRSNFSYAAGGHIFVTGTELTESRREVGRIGDDRPLRAAVDPSDPRIASVHRRSAAYGSLIFGARTVSQQIEGVDFAAEEHFRRGLQVREGSVEDLSDPQLLILPAKAAERLGVQVGESLLVRLQSVTGQQNVGEFRVVAIIEDTASFGQSSAYTSLAYLNSLIGLEPWEYQVYSIFLTDMREIEAVAGEIYQALVDAGALVERPYSDRAITYDDEVEEGVAVLGQMFGQAAAIIAEEPWEGTKFAVMTLDELMKPVVAAMGVLDSIALGIFVILLVITGVGILNTFRMIIIERTREIGTMRAFGMQKGTVRSIFLWEAAFISLGGGAAGLVLAGVIAFFVSRATFQDVPGLDFFLDNGHFTFIVTPADLVVNLGILLFISLLSALLPANAAAKMAPAKALGSHY